MDTKALINNKDFLKHIEEYNNSAKELSNELNSSNIVGKYAELIVCELLDLEASSNSCKDFDAISKKGDKYQIKSRWIKKKLKNTGQYEFGGIKKYKDGYHFDHLILVIFDDDLWKQEVYQISENYIDTILEIGKGKKFAYEKKEKVIFRANKNFFDEIKNNKLIIKMK